MAADLHVHIYEPPGATQALLRGIPRDMLRELQISARWSPSRRGFLIRAERVADVVAQLEYANAAVRYHATEPKR